MRSDEGYDPDFKSVLTRNQVYVEEKRKRWIKTEKDKAFQYQSSTSFQVLKINTFTLSL